ncbi:hypothetical protein [Streptomyces geranii]|uniref:hypothetical protein n=1 Tax=Streptomyces geranii TaxID=2058923 RepID=UPI000D0340C7|nr:hypothetical protein [Streptomyces geranii]
MTTTTDSPDVRASLSVLAAATATHGTGRDDDITLPKLPGFIESAFSPLAYEVAARCLTQCPGDGDRTAVALVSLMGDTTTADLASLRIVSGRVLSPLLFMQATANSVLGHLSREFGITGQMFSLSTLADPLTELLDMAVLLLAEDPELDRILVLGVELGGGERVAAVHRELAAAHGGPVPSVSSAMPASALPPAPAGVAAALLLGRSAGTGRPVEQPDAAQGLFELTTAHAAALPGQGTTETETPTHAHQ